MHLSRHFHQIRARGLVNTHNKPGFGRELSLSLIQEGDFGELEVTSLGRGEVEGDRESNCGRELTGTFVQPGWPGCS